MAMSPNRNEPVLIYATCEQSVLIYHNLDIRSMASYSLLNALSKRIDVLECLQRFHKNCKYLIYRLASEQNFYYLTAGGLSKMILRIKLATLLLIVLWAANSCFVRVVENTKITISETKWMDAFVIGRSRSPFLILVRSLAKLSFVLHIFYLA